MEGNLAENWRAWISQFDLFLLTTVIAEKSPKVQAATFLYLIGDPGRQIFETLEFASGNECEKLYVLKAKFKAYCEPRKNLTFLRHQYFTRNQQAGEGTDTFVVDLQTKARQCDFGDLHDSLIRDRVVCGIRSDCFVCVCCATTSSH